MRRCMVFIDGTNLLTEMSKQINVHFSPYKPSKPVIQLAGMIIRNLLYDRLIIGSRTGDDRVVQRMHWFSSHQGNEHTLLELRTHLREQKFEPTVLPKNKDKNEKGVDVALTREMLINAFNHNYEIGLLISGDEDYIGLVNDAKRFGPLVFGSFFASGLSPELRLSFDHFEQLYIAGNGHNQLIEDIAKLHGKVNATETTAN